MKKSLITILLSAALLSACVKPPSVVTMHEDQFSEVAEFTGVHAFDNPFGGMFKHWFLRSYVNKKNHSITHQLYVNVSYTGDWEFFNYASDQDAKTLNFTEIGRDVGSCSGGCSLDETFGVDISHSTLKKYKDAGYNIKFRSKAGTQLILEVSPEMITKQLNSINEYLSPKKTQ